MTRFSAGFTLIELLIAVAIIAIISAVALPIYNDYVQTSREGVLVSNMSTIRVFQEEFRLREGEYVGGTYTAGAPDASLAELQWDPRTDEIEYEIVANGGDSYTVTATDSTGFSVCREYPGGDIC